MDPYRVYFPLGALTAILGTLAWVGFGFGAVSAYPGLYHPDVMIGGFLFAFAAGFLMTAIPQFTGSDECTRAELGAGILLFLALLGVAFLTDRRWFHLLSLISLVQLAAFCVKRFTRRTYSPPKFFVFVGLGLAMGMGGSAILLGADLGVLNGSWPILGKLVYTQGMILSLILGVGTHLIPAIWGWSDLPIQITNLDSKSGRWSWLGPVLALAAALVLSFALEARWNVEAGRGIRALITTYLAVAHWRILRRPKARGKLVFWLWISAWLLLFGLWIPVFAPAFFMHGIHLAFIGGFGMMTLMVASRVTLAHGGYGYRVELASKLLTGSAFLIVLSALTRLAASLLPNEYLHHLAYAAAAWIIAVLVWSAVFIPKMIRLKEA